MPLHIDGSRSTIHDHTLPHENDNCTCRSQSPRAAAGSNSKTPSLTQKDLMAPFVRRTGYISSQNSLSNLRCTVGLAAKSSGHLMRRWSPRHCTSLSARTPGQLLPSGWPGSPSVFGADQFDNCDPLLTLFIRFIERVPGSSVPPRDRGRHISYSGYASCWT